MQEWVAKRDAVLKSASDDLVAIYAKMQPETAATQIAAMDDQMAAAILGKLKPGVAGAILNEMEAERASKLAVVLSGATDAGEKILMRLVLPPLLLAIAMSMSGCWTSANEFMREPFFSPVGSGLVTDETASIQSAKVLPPPPPSGNGTPPSLYSQPRIANVGDIVRVLISMNDKATLGNASGRSQTTKDGVVVDFGYNNGSSSASSNQPAKLLGDLSSSASTQGTGQHRPV